MLPGRSLHRPAAEACGRYKSRAVASVHPLEIVSQVRLNNTAPVLVTYPDTVALTY
jgi:hypothetical protein